MTSVSQGSLCKDGEVRRAKPLSGNDLGMLRLKVCACWSKIEYILRRQNQTRPARCLWRPDKREGIRSCKTLQG